MDECLLYSEPQLYDLLFPDSREAAYVDDDSRAKRLRASEGFYLQEARQGHGRVLELACGSGRLTVPIAQSGIEISGLDFVEAMLDAARVKAAKAGVAIPFVQGDMRNFKIPGEFSTILMAGNSLLHLLTNHDLLACFNQIKRHLHPDGKFVFDAFNPDVRLLSRDPTQRYPVLRVRDPNRGEITIEEITRYDAAAQTNAVTWYLSSPDAPDFRVVPFCLRVLFPQELELLLQCAGFRLKSRYGEFTRAAFQSNSPRQVCVCTLS